MADVQRLEEMTKLLNETVSISPSGRWDWNDETQTLDFTCFNSSVEIKEKRKKTTSAYQDSFRKHLERISQSKPSARGGQCGLRKIVGPAQLNAYKAAVKRSQRNSVTINHIKQVAVSLVQEIEGLPIPLCFMTVIKSGEMDEFLASLLLYLSCHLEGKALEEHLKSVMAEQSVMDSKVMAKTSAKLELAKKHLAFCYSSLVLGLGLPQHHHMACGRSRMSSTYRDRQLYECLYSFFSYVAWVTFGRKDLKGIQAEIGHLFRSNTFNPVLRAEAEEESEQDEEGITQTEGLSGPVHSRQTAPAKRTSHRRPARSNILTQRSPLMVSLLPSLKEKAPHLFHRSCHLKQQPAKLRDTEDLMKELNQQLASLSFGILGKPLSQFSCTTLMPAKDKSEEGDNEDSSDEEESENDEARSRVTESKISFKGQRSATATAGKRSSLSRAYTMASRATTEVLSSDTE
ncbi:protein phosphatase 1 regulatory subunit 36 [Salminus brasiliensis]|uniref:protein phosphatase 1 regulatory subunit 36 n=1 Tax=Salminus brasiliensis TaxID=930266 RepID=UPI003B835941